MQLRAIPLIFSITLSCLSALSLCSVLSERAGAQTPLRLSRPSANAMPYSETPSEQNYSGNSYNAPSPGQTDEPASASGMPRTSSWPNQQSWANPDAAENNPTYREQPSYSSATVNMPQPTRVRIPKRPAVPAGERSVS